jgi:disulfide bond formation protein DsbB
MTDATATPVSPSGTADRTTVVGPEASATRCKGTGVVPTALGTAALAIPVAAYFWFIDHFSVNIVSFDQWYDIRLLRHWYAGALTLSDLWASHGDHRILFPNLIVVGLAEFTHLNVTFEEYLSALMLVGSAVLVVVAHRRRSRLTPMLWYLPVMLLLFSFVQYQNTLWGFQMAWYLVTLSLVGALYLLDRPHLTQVAFFAAIIAGIVASYSSLQGLTVWPAGLVLLYLRRRSPDRSIIWSACGIAATVLYFYDWKPGGFSDPTYLFTNPVASLKFFLFLLGSVLGTQSTAHPAPEVAFGGVLVAVAIVLIVFCWRRDERTGRPFAVALILYGLLFGVSVTVGRAWYGLYAPSRYAECGLFVLAGCYLVLAQRPEDERRYESEGGTDAGTNASSKHRRGWGTVRTAGWVVILAGIALQIVFGTGHGFASAKAWSQAQAQAADTIANYRDAAPALLSSVGQQGSRSLSSFMAAHDLSVFGTAKAASYAHRGLFPPLTAVHAAVAGPRAGSVLHGVAVLVAEATDPSGVRSVQFVGRDNGHHLSFTTTATATVDGWVATWDTRTAENGDYTLTAVATGYGAKRGESAPVRVTVRN